VELTGALAGFTLALQNTRLIALSGLITGIAASLSMAASEYLSTRSEETRKNPVRAALYTGIAYVLTVSLLILPYLLFQNYYLDLAISLITAVAIIAVFNFYISIARGEPFRRRFVEMAGLRSSLWSAAFASSSVSSCCSGSFFCSSSWGSPSVLQQPTGRGCVPGTQKRLSLAQGSSSGCGSCSGLLFYSFPTSFLPGSCTC
jgi:hypothetical protein